MAKRKSVFISAGESHSAAISEKLKLFTWGNGAYGRLGHGIDTNERRPKLVDTLEQFEVTSVSCGAFHTLAITSQGHVYAFGQGKYGKLGINRKEKDGISLTPLRITIYKQVSGSDERLLPDNVEFLQVAAGYNHSMGLSRIGKGYTWGYAGKGLLGRPKEIENYLPLEIGASPGEFSVKLPNLEEMVQRGE